MLMLLLLLPLLRQRLEHVGVAQERRAVHHKGTHQGGAGAAQKGAGTALRIQLRNSWMAGREGGGACVAEGVGKGGWVGKYGALGKGRRQLPGTGLGAFMKQAK